MQQGYRPPSYTQMPQIQPQAKPRVRKKHSGLIAILTLVLLCALALGGIYANAYFAVKPYEQVFAGNISIDGIPLSGMTADEGYQAVWQNVNARQGSWSLALAHNGFTYSTLNFATLGITIDGNQVNAALNAAWARGHTGTVFDRKADLDALAKEPFAAYTTQSESSDTHLDYILNAIADNLHRTPSDARLLYFDPNADEPFTFQDETYGAYLDVEKAKAAVYQMVSATQSGTLELTTEPIAPSVTRAQLEKQVALLATGITPISTSSSENRTQNIRVSFTKINGMTLKPGESFSFNNVVGWRTRENGYLEAPEYIYGELVQGYGGGVCQSSTTVYLAAVCSGMKITKRVAHSDPVNYTLLGQDATVYLTRDRKIDFTFQNSLDGPVYITAKVIKDPASAKRLICEVKMYGPSMGEGVFYRLNSNTVKTLPTPIEVETIEDKAGTHVIYTDQEYEVRKAREGYVVETYLQRVENGVMVSEKLITTDTYPARKSLVYVGVRSR